MTVRKSTSFNQFLSLLASVVLVIGLLPAYAFADDGTTYNVIVDGGTAQPTEAYQGQEVTVTADAPDTGMFFKYWTSDRFDQDGFADAAATVTTFTMPDNPVNITAVFARVLVDPIDDQTYTGDPIEPGVGKVELEGVDRKLIEKEDYTVSYRNNTNHGNATAVITLQGDLVGSAEVVFGINPADISTATVEAEDQVYNGTELEPAPVVTWNGKQLSEDDYIVSYANNVEAGTATVTVVGKGNFQEVTSASGTFEIAKRPLTITADSAKQTYNGKPLTANGFSSEGLVDGDRIDSAKVEGTLTDAGKVANKVSGAKIVNADGKDVTANYDISYKEGTLTVEPAQASIKVSSASKVEGEADPAFSGKVEGLVKDGDLGEVAYKRTGTDEKPGSYPGVITATYKDNANYKVTVTNGDFTITAKPAEKGEYKVVSGAGSSWEQASSEALTFTFKRSSKDETTLDHFTGVLVDGNIVPAENYGIKNWEAKKGSLILSLQPAYLKTLSVGKHTLTAQFDDGDPVAVEFTVKAKSNPSSSSSSSTKSGSTASTAKTSDEMGGATATASTVALFAALLVVFSAAALHRRREE